VLNSGAFEMATHILTQIGDWCRMAGVRPARDAVSDLTAWSLAYQGEGVFYTAQMERWADDIRGLLDPWKTCPINGACPAPECGATAYAKDDGSVDRAVAVEYDSALASYDRRAAEATMRARCRVCDAEWVGSEAITELIEELGGE
jgi:hypothetical protein